MAVVTLQDVRDEGVSTAMASDSKVNATIAACEQTFNNACGQWFEPVSATVVFDGDDSRVMFFQVPIISITEVRDLETDMVIEAENYTVYNGRTLLQDDRRNPKLALKNGYAFRLGRGRYQFTGSFGFTESDDSAPPEVHRAMLMFVIEKLLQPIVPDAHNHDLPEANSGLSSGPVIEEMTDDHRIKYGASVNSYKAQKSKLNSDLTQSPYILGVMNRYRAPMKIRAPADWRFPNLYAGPELSDIF